ncbi:DUF2490 domain-containing protein [Winogradskyella endarachnes]|uniref:DUF2490 domain-containing protein n=1 Tax=Winogradskyella endarachnes TaxID=2681965 RepID=A0A6L6U7Z6_9FLAO|nr:DUF2490 domain-containing protein [Winogradskyella endarachnes]MUU78393.1 DUF2490 domain-containing protein [Winogradskyella endarachnes]
MKIYLFLIIIFLFSLSQIKAQNTKQYQFGSWYEITASTKISDKFGFFGSLTSWNYKLPAENSHLLLAIVGVKYQLNPKTSVGLGYAYGDIDSSFEENDTPNIKEHRILEQLVFNHKLNKIKLSQRFRLEQRFLEYETENLLKHRLRYRFKGKIPINNTLFVSIYDEIHFYLNQFDFQQNRIFGGLGVSLNKNMSAEFGYARHSFKTKSYDRLSVQLNLKFNSRKKQKQ